LSLLVVLHVMMMFWVFWIAPAWSLTFPQSPANLRFVDDPPPVGGAQTFYVAPDGTASGDGSPGNPWDIMTALAHPSVVKPGDVIYLRGGRYDNTNVPGKSFHSILTGTAEAPITVRSAPGEWAILDFQGGPFGGGITLAGAWATYRDFEVTSSALTHVSTQSSSHPTDILRTGFTAAGQNLRIFNLVIHDLVGVGLGAYRPDQNIEIYGNIIYYNGYQAPDRGHGHGIYIQNETGVKLVAENIIFNQYHSGLHLFGTSAFVQNMTFKGNIAFNNGAVSRQGALASNIILATNKTTIENITITENYTYFHRPQGQNRLGHSRGRGLIARDNYFIGGLFAVVVRKWRDLNFTNNTIWGEVYNLQLVYPDGSPSIAYVWDENSYVRGTRLAQYRLGDTTPVNYAFPSWQNTTGLDTNSTEQATGTGRPTGVTVFVRPNRYEVGRANIVVYNWDEHETIEVEVGQVLVPGMAYEVRNVMNYFGPPVVQGVYDGQPLTLPMTGLKVVAPHGNAPTHPSHPGPVFGAFVLRVP